MITELLVLSLGACRSFPSSSFVVKRSSIVLRLLSSVGHTCDAELWKHTHRAAQRRRPRILRSYTQEPARCHLPLLEQKLFTPGSSSTAAPLADIGPKPFGCTSSLHLGCHPLEDTRRRPPGSGISISETPSKGFCFVAARSRVPRRATCSPLKLRRLLAQGTFQHCKYPALHRTHHEPYSYQPK